MFNSLLRLILESEIFLKYLWIKYANVTIVEKKEKKRKAFRHRNISI